MAALRGHESSNRLTAPLEDEGFDVVAVSSFREVIDRLDAPAPKFALMLLDQHLGDGAGAELVPEVRRKSSRVINRYLF